MSTLARLRGDARVARGLARQRRALWGSPERVRADRDRRVRAIVRYAAQHVPFYREWFRASGIDPRELRTAEDLDRLPLLDSRRYQADPRAFVADTALAREGAEFNSSGSTGTPIRIRHDRDSIVDGIAYGERERAVRAALCGRARGLRELALGRPNSTDELIRSFCDRCTWFPLAFERMVLPATGRIDAAIEAMNAFRPDILRGFGSYSEFLFRFAHAHGIAVHRPRVLVVIGDAMSDAGIRFLEETFGIPVLGLYNAVEAFKLGFSCELRRGYHIHEDICTLRIVGADGARVAPGTVGEVVISNLTNRATVLLNYRLGDIARLAPAPCACGRALPLLDRLEGRTEDIILTADGRAVHGRSVLDAVLRVPGIVRYQLVQHEPGRFELRVIAAPERLAEISATCVPALRELLGPAIRVELTRHDDLPPDPSGKFRSVISARP
ncbi:MAG: phenylacetate--CoA ligase family protein [Acidobacteria bacterium]|nr:phenylacetate--CoA ligase family protein [Acidobacteriota bacterium]